MSKPAAFGVQFWFWGISATWAVLAVVNAAFGVARAFEGHWIEACFNAGAVALIAGLYRWIVRPNFVVAYRKARKCDQDVRADEIAALEKELGLR